MNRRHFFETTASLVGFAVAASAFRKNVQYLSFSTLGCPDWTFPSILKFAAEHDYNGIEIRGIQRQLDLTKCPEFNSKSAIAESRSRLKDYGLALVDLGSSAEMHHTEPEKQKQNLDEAKRFIDLANELSCPYIRVFPNKLPQNDQRNATLDLIAKNLLELGDYAKGSSVTVLIESHGDLVHSNELQYVLKNSEHDHVGLIWDIHNMWSITKEPVDTVYQTIKKYIRHTHIKDARVINGKEQYVLLGEGESPIFNAIDILAKNNYKGYYSFEWEKLWHPEIEQPEIAIAHYSKAMRQHFNKLQNE